MVRTIQQTPLGRNIRSRRNVLGVTQKHVAHCVGIPAKSLSDIETGFTANPRVLTVARIATALQTTVDRLLEVAE